MYYKPDCMWNGMLELNILRNTTGPHIPFPILSSSVTIYRMLPELILHENKHMHLFLLSTVQPY